MLLLLAAASAAARLLCLLVCSSAAAAACGSRPVCFSVISVPRASLVLDVVGPMPRASWAHTDTLGAMGPVPRTSWAHAGTSCTRRDLFIVTEFGVCTRLATLVLTREFQTRANMLDCLVGECGRPCFVGAPCCLLACLLSTSAFEFSCRGLAFDIASGFSFRV